MIEKYYGLNVFFSRKQKGFSWAFEGKKEIAFGTEAFGFINVQAVM